MYVIILLPLNFVKAVIDFVKIVIDLIKQAEEIGLTILFKRLQFCKILKAVMKIDFQIPQPDLLVYLHSTIEKLQWNILNRGRVYERKIEESYLQGLQETYL
jgi:deoxyadenosine/deoxycytidine kinase